MFARMTVEGRTHTTIKIKFKRMKLFQTKAYKVVIGYVYGWGATAVIVGALFKIMHFPGAGIVLTVGMLVEAFIFFVSVFEPSMEHYDWARVFPVLGKSGADWDKAGADDFAQAPINVPAHAAGVVKQKESVVATAVNANVDLGLEAADLDKLKAGINKIAETADQFAGIAVNAPEVASRLAKASASFEELGERTQEVGKVLETSVKGLAGGCDEMNKILLESTEDLTVRIKNNCEKLSVNMGRSADNFDSLGKIMDEQLRNVKSQAENYTQQISAINKNISALNALYELQIHETQGCLESFRGMQGDMSEMLEHVSLSVDSAKLFKQESQQLANNVASLNSVYGNMLSVVNNN